MVTAVEL